MGHGLFSCPRSDVLQNYENCQQLSVLYRKVSSVSNFTAHQLQVMVRD